MKKICYLLSMMAFVLMSCSKDDTTDFRLSAESYTWDASVTEQTVSISTSSNWQAKSNVAWCEPWKSSGTKDDKLVLWVSPNLTSSARQGELTIRSGSTTKTITLRQLAYTGSLDDYEYRLPVIFHILYKDKTDEKQYVREGHLADIMTKVNKLYSDNSIKVQFEMAKYDEDGNQLDEAGVMRHQVDFDDFDCNDFLKQDETTEKYAKYGQNYKKFINIFVFKFKVTGKEKKMGVSTLPLMPSAYPLESLFTQDGLEQYIHVASPWGCCINNEYIYDLSDQYYLNTDIVVTIAHELGHYLGLLHTFSDNGCLEDDACNDTPVSDYNSYIEWINGYVESKGADAHYTLTELATRQECHTDTAFIADNIMDYAYCFSNKLTSQQRHRIRYVLSYCAVMNGPKLVDYLSATQDRTRSAGKKKDVPVVLSNCPQRPVLPSVELLRK